MEFTERKKKILIYLTKKLMIECGIELRDTWSAAENELLEIQKTPGNGPCLFVAEKDTADNFSSLTYKNPIIVLPEEYGGAAHPVIHEAVHFMQHNDREMENAYFNVRKFNLAGFKEFVSQREETEAHFIQMLFIARYEPHVIKPRELKQFKNRIFKAITKPDIRISALCWAVKNDVIIKQGDKN